MGVLSESLYINLQRHQPWTSPHTTDHTNEYKTVLVSGTAIPKYSWDSLKSYIPLYLVHIYAFWESGTYNASFVTPACKIMHNTHQKYLALQVYTRITYYHTALIIFQKNSASIICWTFPYHAVYIFHGQLVLLYDRSGLIYILIY